MISTAKVIVSVGYIRRYVGRVRCDIAAWRCCIADYPTDANLVRCCLNEVKPDANAPRLKISPTQYCIDRHQWNGRLEIALRQFWIGSSTGRRSRAPPTGSSSSRHPLNANWTITKRKRLAAASSSSSKHHSSVLPPKTTTKLAEQPGTRSHRYMEMGELMEKVSEPSRPSSTIEFLKVCGDLHAKSKRRYLKIIQSESKDPSSSPNNINKASSSSAASNTTTTTTTAATRTTTASSSSSAHNRDSSSTYSPPMLSLLTTPTSQRVSPQMSQINSRKWLHGNSSSSSNRYNDVEQLELAKPLLTARSSSTGSSSSSTHNARWKPSYTITAEQRGSGAGLANHHHHHHLHLHQQPADTLSSCSSSLAGATTTTTMMTAATTTTPTTTVAAAMVTGRYLPGGTFGMGAGRSAMQQQQSGLRDSPRSPRPAPSATEPDTHAPPSPAHAPSPPLAPDPPHEPARRTPVISLLAVITTTEPPGGSERGEGWAELQRVLQHPSIAHSNIPVLIIANKPGRNPRSPPASNSSSAYDHSPLKNTTSTSDLDLEDQHHQHLDPMPVKEVKQIFTRLVMESNRSEKDRLLGLSEAHVLGVSALNGYASTGCRYSNYTPPVRMMSNPYNSDPQQPPPSLPSNSARPHHAPMNAAAGLITTDMVIPAKSTVVIDNNNDA
ncbi:hypothetical protein PCANC_16292 [Puccinia coronata f. sp. avenae]|uniref:Uncharacterized protein n=1 Tax=Puccinia coronata f. sp. avenae TaxID=200324 RepID=A0A2N5UH21_9BASI|nr:hypothetical protein PCANC_16292 [Puccinia coronata f. sp. avenae]